MLDRVRSEFTAEAGTLVTAEGQRRVHQTICVDPHRARLQTSRDHVGFLDVARPDGCGQAVWIVIGALDDLIDVVKCQYRKDWPKDLFPRDLHLVLHVAEDRGLDKESFVAIYRHAIATGYQLRAVALSRFYETKNSFHLLLADDRTETSFGIARVRGTHLRRAGHQLLGE